MVPKEFITQIEVCQKFGIARQTLRNWRSLHKYFNFYKIGRRVFYREEELKEYFKKHKIVVDDIS